MQKRMSGGWMMGDLSKHFSKDELACPCCGACDMSRWLIEVLEDFRKAWGKPIIPSSGYRCIERNRFVGGASNSSHLDGLAVDIPCESATERWEMLETARRFFKRIGIYPSHIHVDVDRMKPQNVIWVGG